MEGSNGLVVSIIAQEILQWISRSECQRESSGLLLVTRQPALGVAHTGEIERLPLQQNYITQEPRAMLIALNLKPYFQDTTDE